jgi:hypothetical protein
MKDPFHKEILPAGVGHSGSLLYIVALDDRSNSILWRFSRREFGVPMARREVDEVGNQGWEAVASHPYYRLVEPRVRVVTTTVAGPFRRCRPGPMGSPQWNRSKKQALIVRPIR